MPRVIPETMPDSIADDLYEKWGDLKSFVDACAKKDPIHSELYNYTRMYSVLVRSSHKPLYRLQDIATTIGGKVSMEKVAEAFLKPTPEERRAAFQALCDKGDISISELCRRTRVSTALLYGILNGELSSETYRIYLTSSKVLELSLAELLLKIEKRAA